MVDVPGVRRVSAASAVNSCRCRRFSSRAAGPIYLRTARGVWAVWICGGLALLPRSRAVGTRTVMRRRVWPVSLARGRCVLVYPSMLHHEHHSPDRGEVV